MRYDRWENIRLAQLSDQMIHILEPGLMMGVPVTASRDFLARYHAAMEEMRQVQRILATLMADATASRGAHR